MAPRNDKRLPIRRITAASSSISNFLQRLSSPKTDPPEQVKLGFHLITEPQGTPRATIIFVHGLGGHPIKTWCFQRNQEYFWPQEWLPYEFGLENVRICTYGYAADFATTQESTVTIIDFSKRLNLEILTFPVVDCPIIFIAHSMGGLVIKKAYMLALQDPRYKKAAECMKNGAMVFLGTPHRGSDSAVSLHRLLSATVGSKGFIQELMRNSGTIIAINEDFRYHAKHLTLWSFHETQPTYIGPGKSMILVDRGSAILGYETEGSSHIDADHHGICKFQSPEDAGYRSIKQLLIYILSNAAEKVNVDSPVRQYASQRRPSGSVKELSQILGQEDGAQEELLFFRDSRVVSGTCQWVYGKDSFEWWQSDSHRSNVRYLWLKGKPAMGKSVLMSGVIDELHQDGKFCAYYFFRVNNSDRHATRAFMLSIIAQMAIYVPDFYERLLEIDQHHANIHSMSARILWQKIFVDTLFELRMEHPWYLIIDAVDEAEKPAEIISYIGKIHSITPIKVFVSSRVGMDLDREFQRLRLSPEVFRQETIQAEDTKDDMSAYINQQLETLPFDFEDKQHVISMIVEKSQGIFLWVQLALEEILVTVHSKDGIQEALELMPSEMGDFFQQILDNMSTHLRPSNKKIAKAILQYTVCATRPLRTTELQAALKPEFGHIQSLEYTINLVCPHLIKVEESTLHVQPIHSTVREFLLQESLSEFAVDSRDAHQKLATITLNIWQEDRFDEPISLRTSFSRKHEALDQVHPLLRYSTQSWFEHLQDANIDKNLIVCLKTFLRAGILTWIEASGLLGSLRFLTQAGQVLDKLTLRCLVTTADRDLLSGWAVDLVRIVPKFGRNITKHPFSIHKLIPPFCPYHTCIGSQFGSNGDIAIVGSSMKKWDDCLAHITVGRNGESCKAIVCSETYIAVALSDFKGTFVIYSSETCQELRRMNHGERIGAMDMDTTGEWVVTGGHRFIKTWNIKTGAMTTQFQNDQGARCLALSFQSDNRKIIAVSSDNTLSIWDPKRMDREHVRWARPSNQGRYRGAPWGVSIGSEGNKVALAFKGWPIEVWDINDREISSVIPARNPLVARFNPTNSDVYVADGDGTIARCVPETEFRLEIDAQSHVMRCNPNGTLLATGNGDGWLQVFTADTLELLYKLDKYDDSIVDLAFSPDGTRLYDIRGPDCNVWIPQVLLVNAQKDEVSSSEESESSRQAISTLLESKNSLQNIGSLVSNPTGEYVCCGHSNGRVCIYDTKSGKRLQTLYRHAPTVNIEALVWSSDGLTIASGDDSGRLMVVSLEPDLPDRWKCTVKLDFRLDFRIDGGIRQLLIDDKGDRLLVSSQRAASMFLLADGSLVGARQDHSKNESPCWLTHPGNPETLILFASEFVKLYVWNNFSELTRPGGISLAHDPFFHAKHWNFEDKSIRTRAYATQDGMHIVSCMQVIGERSASTHCGFWLASDLDVQSESTREVSNLSDMYIHDMVGVFRNRAVFLDRELWVCTRAADESGDVTRHFYVPSDWLNTNEDQASIITVLGEFIYDKHGELIIVKRGMRCKQDFGGLPLPLM